MKYLLAAATTMAIFVKPAYADDNRTISFPDTQDGSVVLAIDTHVHTVFSDGLVWPSVRVTEAVLDGLDAFVVTDHIDTQRHHEDIPNPDRNRSFEIARQAALKDSAPVLVINGVEIAHPTKLCIECAHFNAVFIEDANRLRHREWNGLLTFKTDAPLKDAFEAVEAARSQGSFIIWNHPTENGDLKIIDPVDKMLQNKFIDGIEVVNGTRYSEDAFQFALDNDLAIIGASDIHRTVDDAFDLAHGGHRTATLVLAQEKSDAALKQALEAHRTVALSYDTLMGREQDVRAIVEASLVFRLSDPTNPTSVVIRNTASSPFSLQRAGSDRIMTASPVIVVPALGEITIRLYPITGKKPRSIDFDVLNALTGPRHPLRITLGGDGHPRAIAGGTQGQDRAGTSAR